MRATLFAISCGLGCALVWLPASGRAEPTGTAFTYQGQLKEAGAPITGDVNFVFYAWDAEVGGNLVDSVSAPAVPVTDGLFTVALDFGAGVFSGEARWLEIEVEFPPGAGNWTTLAPRQAVNAAPYALYALEGGGDSPWETVSSDIYYDAGNVGIGITAPLVPLQVESTTLYTVHARNRRTAGTSYGGFFRSDSDGGYGLIGYASAATGATVGVFGETESADSTTYGVFGRTFATLGDGRGVYGRTDSDAGTGVYGEAVAGTGTNFGVRGTVTSPNGYASYFTGGRNYFEGNVGIGEMNPQAKLHIGGTPDVDGIMFPDGTLQTTAATGGAGDGHSLDAVDGSPVDAVYVDADGKVRMNRGGLNVWDNAGHGVSMTSDSFSFREATSEDPVYEYSSSTDEHVFYTGGNPQLVVDDAGNVGIGLGWAQNPAAKLHVGGTPGVDGLMFPDGTLQTTAAVGGGGDSLWSESGSNIFYTAGRVGVGTSSPGYRLHVVDSSSTAIYGECQGEGTRGELGSESGGVFGEGLLPNSVGVYGFSTASTGNGDGVRGETESETGHGVYGENHSGAGNAIGVHGVTSSPTGFGGYFEGRGYFSGNVGVGTTDPNCPLDVQSSSSSSVIRGTATGSGINYAIRGHTDSGWGYAGYFTGGRNYFEGYVGIGNSEPQESLDVIGVVKTSGLMVTNGAAAGRVMTSDAYGFGTWQVPSSSPWSVTGSAVYYDAGNVGIGTSSPTESLHVADDAQINGNLGISTAPSAFAAIDVQSDDDYFGIRVERTATVNGAAITGTATATSGDVDGVRGSTNSVDGAGVSGIGEIGVQGWNNTETGMGVLGTHHADTGVGPGVYGITNSEAELAAGVKGEATTTSGEFTIGVMGLSHSPAGVGVYGRADTGNAAMGGYFISESPSGKGIYAYASDVSGYAGWFIGRSYFGGNVGIVTTTPVAELDVDGTARVEVLQIDGGADLSENFTVEGSAEPGMVVVIDAEHPGGLCASRGAYDRRVAGIISGAGGVQTGMLMSQEGSLADGEHAVALTGRVYCWCEAFSGAIEPGDMLTTSDTPGHAMKVTDYPRAQGAIIGKAMTALEEGKGLVLVLVNLQ